MGTNEISIKVALAVGDIRTAVAENSLTYKEISELIGKASKEYGISENHIRTVGCFPKKDTKQLIKVYNDYDDDDD